MESSGEQQTNRVRASAAEIYENVKRDAADELARPAAALGFSGLFAGATVGFGALASAAAVAALAGHHGAKLIGALFFPIGFIAVIVGRSQLFTENTLYPVTLVLDERGHVLATLRLWAVVLAANLVGVCLFALLVVLSGAIPPDLVSGLASDGLKVTQGNWSSFFWSGVLGGWLIALRGVADPGHLGGDRAGGPDLGARVGSAWRALTTAYRPRRKCSARCSRAAFRSVTLWPGSRRSCWETSREAC